MPEWANYRNFHIAIRVITGAYLTAIVGWTLYNYYNQRRGQDGRADPTFKRTDGDAVEDEDEDRSIKPDIDTAAMADKNDEESDSEKTENSDDSMEDDESEPEEDSDEEEKKDIVDIEDIDPEQRVARQQSSQNGVKLNGHAKRRHRLQRAMSPVDYNKFKEEQLTDRLRGDLSKQGYRLIETHSAVKICRWTKNSMRGRGGCYKHTFYGIKSYQCMEMTPNLACASKCTFCWRHHKNPTGTEWKWKMDPPDIIVEQGIKNHLEMVRQLKGVPGVTKERFDEAQTVRHCALSLVGEPIFYPRINELLEILHAQKISTFLVTNAQFPDAMRHLVPVTQLYVSIDAPNKETLKKVDRPLYRDFWQRYIECLEIISEKKQRTVFRLTLVQKANMEDLEGYAKLIDIGQPDFIEIKGVTFCGTSKANKLTMENVPWHEQVIEFAQQLLNYIPFDMYELACEHSHSNCVLIANKKFKIDGKWHTWIDYEKYFELIKIQATRGGGGGEGCDFSSLDYAAETPSWAIFGSEEGGFDPEHIRWIRKDHKLRLLTERIAAQRNCTTENKESEASQLDSLKSNDAIAIEQNS